MVDGSKFSVRFDSSFLQYRSDELLKELKIPSICDSCVNQALCAAQHKACEEFTEFVEAVPGAVLPEVLKKMEGEIAKDGSKRVPTHAEYLKHFVH